METLIDKYIDQGRQQGKIQLLIKMLEARFGVLPQWARERIEAAHPEKLDELSIRLLTVDSLNDVLDRK